MKNIYRFFAAILMLLAVSQASAETMSIAGYTQTLFNSDSEMESNDANDVIQTRDGYIWAASYRGLLRYDGKTFTRYSKDSSKEFAASSATCLHEDKAGRLWIGTNLEGLYCLEEGKFRRIPNLADSAFDLIRAVTSDSRGNIFVGSSGGIGVLTEEGIRRVELGDFDSEFIFGLVCDREDNIWGVSRSGRAIVFKDGRIRQAFDEKDIPGHGSISLLVRSDGTVIAGLTDGGIARAEMKNGSYVFGELFPSAGIIGINGLYEDRKNRLWACGDNGFGYYNEKYDFVSVKGGLINNSLEKIYQDYEGNFWLASSREGLLHIVRNKFMNINFAASLPRGVVNSVQPFGGLIYIATDEGLNAVDSGYQRVEDRLTERFKGVRIRNLMKDSGGRLWVSTYNAGGLVSVDPAGKMKVYSKKDGLPNENIRMSLELSNGDIAVATNDGAGIIRNGKIIKTYTQQDGLFNSTILNMCEDDKGRLYLGSDGGGIFCAEEGVLKNYGKKEGLRSGVILRMLHDGENGGIWISTSTSLDFFKNSEFHPIPVQPDLVGAGLYDIKKTPDGRLMLLTDTGVHIADARDLLSGKTPSFTSYSKKDGLRSSVTANSWSYTDHDGKLYLCCANGAYEIDLINVLINNESPKIAIRKAEVDGMVYENPKKLTLSSDVKRLTLHLAVLSYVNPEYNRAEFSLKGFDNEKTVSMIKDLTPITYTNLSGGEYTFEFNAANSDGIPAATPVNLVITKEKLLLEQPLFILALITLAAAVIILMTRAYYRRRNAELEKRQAELRAITVQSITAIANTIDAKDPYTKGHSARVAEYAVSIAKKIGLDADKIDNLYYTALLHDIGKIGISDKILKKEGKLTDEEYELMKQHPAIGGDILESISIINDIKEGAAFHHEKYDGTGYNTGLKGEHIPVTARIICVADSFDAMATTRPYREQRSLEYIISELKTNEGTQFDPLIAEIMIGLIDSGEIKVRQDGEDQQ
ncbi:MAG: two-component regulator propeller domain-containing protein [Synergistota bacterium]|nr:two-component regulator propeller domain-containing protein [Synergistota bacterium]